MLSFLNYKNDVIRLNTINVISTNNISNIRYSVIPDTSSLNQRSLIIDFNARLPNCHSDQRAKLYLCSETLDYVIILLGGLCVFFIYIVIFIHLDQVTHLVSSKCVTSNGDIFKHKQFYHD